MTILDFAAASPAGFARRDVVDARYHLLEPLDDETPPAVWRAHDVVLGHDVILDLVQIDGGEICLETLLGRLGLDLAAVLDAGDSEKDGTFYVYIASELPMATRSLTAAVA